MLVSKQHDGASRLHVKWGRGVFDGVVYEEDDALVGDGRFFGEGEDRASDLDGVEEGDLIC